MSIPSRIERLPEESEIPWFKKRKLIYAMVLVAVILVGGAGIGLKFLYPRFNFSRRYQVIAQAQALREAHDYRALQALLERAVQVDPGNYPARRLLAAFYVDAGSVRAVEEWRALTEAEPANAENWLGLTETALRFGDVGSARAALAKLQEANPGDSEVLRLEAAYALSTRNRVELERCLIELARRQPEDAKTQFTLAALRLAGGTPAQAEQARQSLEKLARDDRYRIRATLELLRDAPHRWPGVEIDEAYRRLAGRILRGSEAPALLGGRVDLGTENRSTVGMSDLLAFMESQPRLELRDVLPLGDWMIRQGRAREARVWLQTLDPQFRRVPAVAGLEAAAAIATKEWGALRALLRQGAWGPIGADALESAFAAQEKAAASADGSADWNRAVRLAQDAPSGLRVLQKLAEVWGWTERRRQVLNLIARQYPREEWAWRALAEIAIDAGDTGQLVRLYETWVKAVPTLASARLEKLMLAVLTQPPTTSLLEETKKMLEQTGEVQAARIVYAAALWRNGEAGPALQVLDEKPLNYRDEPRFALVRGLILSSLDQPLESERLLAGAAAIKLLPEERELVREAHRRNGRN